MHYLILLKSGAVRASTVKNFWREIFVENDERAVEEARKITNKNGGQIIYIVCKEKASENVFVKFD